MINIPKVKKEMNKRTIQRQIGPRSQLKVGHPLRNRYIKELQPVPPMATGERASGSQEQPKHDANPESSHEPKGT